jgi:predicted Zn-dependent protease
MLSLHWVTLSSLHIHSLHHDATGGRVFVCTGILPLLETGDHEQMLAALLGHEIGHCVASAHSFILPF